jgi:hypothetical protein
MYQSEQINELATALSKFQGELPTVGKNKTVKIVTKAGRTISFSYAELSAILSAIKNPLSKHGLSVSQDFQRDGERYHIVTLLFHSSGQWLKSELPLNVHAADIKDLGSQITYSRRYALTSMLGICADDDDEETLEGNVITAPAKQVTPPKPVYISRDDALALKEKIGACEESFQKNIYDFLRGLDIHSLDRLPIDRYDQILRRVNRKLEEQEAELVTA